MTLDFWLVARLAQDLNAYLNGVRIQSISVSGSDLIFYCYRRGTHVALHVSVDSNEPLVAAYECDEPQKESGTAGWVTSVSALLRGATIDAIHAVPNDRVLFVDVSSRSAFGVPSRSRIAIELQPRKANALVLREGDDGRWVIVAAAKQFEGASDARRVTTGATYEVPPVRRPLLDRAHFLLTARETDPADNERLARLLGDFDPECTPPLAREVMYRAGIDPTSAAQGRALLEVWMRVHHEVENALETAREVFVIRKGAKPTLCHLISLSWASVDAEQSSAIAATAPSVNAVCVEVLHSRTQPTKGAHGPDKLRKKLTTLIARGRDESKRLEAARNRASDASSLREAGETIYAHLTEITPGADRFETEDGRRVALDPLLTPKENAAEYFRQYKKARSGLPRVEARLRTLRFNREHWEQLLWELEQAETRPVEEREALIVEVADALGFKSQHKRKRRERTQERRVTLSGNAVAMVGRSPKENERLTFSVAGPNDYWFHARGIPGAHVIVKTNGAEISHEQVEEAAALAAGHSRAADSAHVEVDYTQRKHVRRHSSGRAGLVWYTDFQTVRVRPNTKT